MAKLKKLAANIDELVQIEVPVTDSEIQDREKQYYILSSKRFATKFRTTLFRPVKMNFRGKEIIIQMNTCINPYCKNFGMQQTEYNVKQKPKRYKLSSSYGNGVETRISCNSDPINLRQITLGCLNTTLSNWSVAEEIKRLDKINSVVSMDPIYQFHKEDCNHPDTNPFEHKDKFYRRGKSSSNSQKYQCKECKKITNVLPTTKRCTTYHQQRNDILPQFAELVTNRIPVSRAIEILGIGAETYYHKLEWLYTKCLEFLERHESKLKEKAFNEMWVNTDKMIYYLNNVRKKGAGSKYLIEQEEKQFHTQVVISSDILSKYVFRTDIAYDWDITLIELTKQTVTFKDDHLHTFSQRYGHLRMSYAPQPPTEFDTQTLDEYRRERFEFSRRADYIDGLHVNSTYTTIAHLWHLKQLLNVKEWRFATDEDSSIMSALFRVFSKEIDLGNAHHFLYKIDKSKSFSESRVDFKEAREIIREWAFKANIDGENLIHLARLMLAEELKRHKFYEEIEKDGIMGRKWAKNPIRHPLPFRDTGYAKVDCTTDVSSLESIELARMIQKINNKSTDTFINQIRRRISILERPLVTSRGDGRSYIYSNFSPKYAQYAITILRTYYNFCKPYRAYKKILTPAERIGIVDKAFDWKDIIYFR